MSWFSSFTEQISELAEQTKKSVSDAAASVSETVQNLDAQKVSSLVQDIYIETTKEFLLGSTGTELEKRNANRLDRAVQLKLVPWKVYDEAKSELFDELQTRVLKLSESEDTFLVSAPDDTVFQFNFDGLLPFAYAALAEDKSLSQQRYLLVPKRVEEDDFWRNYFYRVQLVRNQLDVPPLSEEIIQEYIVQIPDVPDSDAILENEDQVSKQESEKAEEHEEEVQPAPVPVADDSVSNQNAAEEEEEEDFVTDMISQEDLRNMRKELGIKQPQAPDKKKDDASTEDAEDDEILNDLLADMDSGDIDDMNDDEINSLLESGV